MGAGGDGGVGALTTDALILAAVALAPAIPLYIVNPRLLWQARSYWLLGLLAASAVFLAPREPWLALIALWYALRWWQEDEPFLWLPSAVTWVAVGATWALLLRVPYLDWAPWGWLAVAGYQSGLVIVMKYQLRNKVRPTGTLGSPVLTAMFLAMVAPFCPWWGWPVLGLALVCLWSWRAFLGLTAGLVWLYPDLTPYGAGIVALAGFLWLWSPEIGGRRLWEWTPRGDTFDSVVSWVRNLQLVRHHVQARPWLGYGPETMEPALLKWGSRYNLELTWGELHCDPLHLLYEYGLLGFLAVVAFAWRIAPHLVLGDPWSAAWIAGGVMAWIHWPLRNPAIGVTWLAISAGVVRW